ncbi:hypothetical protein CU669_11380 [Paramagnetospirillum kuznetsovii]|uniref:Type II toxin-antitoxin system ParD family antitoxin n=1 Tax=Paramagnetospirillum kuznetsovii TaxID=2053833 RepID=A0A364NYB2_9PROT|nr:hypothetical protein [Paramagnetospirillum kuznetsovii]RAU21895.1 hypothetical protein CU669_11380 [Paramagnetospirillum kuznetsovii]
MRVNREFLDPDLAGFLQTAEESAIAVALAGGEAARVKALRAALDDGVASGESVDAGPVFQRLLAKYGAADR